MPVQQESKAIAVATAHVEAWSNHNYDAARSSLADDVTVTATTVDPVMPKTDLAGIDDYMRGLIEFGQAVAPGSARVIASVGDDTHALLLVTVRAAFGPNAPEITLAGARLYLLDGNDRIKAEQVTFFATTE